MDLYSLRSRYASISVILGILVLLCAVGGHYLSTHTREAAAQNIETRRQLLMQSREIRNAIWQVREVIGQFLIDPKRRENQSLIHQRIDELLASTQQLLDMHTQLNKAQRERILYVTTLTHQLQTAARELITIRLDSRLQFPSLELARDEMVPQQQSVFDAFQLALDETATELEHDPERFALYQLLVQARHRWSTIILNVRMLIANRLGSYDIDTLATQEKNIEIYIADLNDNLRQLKAMQTESQMGFNTNNAVTEIVQLTRMWDREYHKLINIHNSHNWRSDALQLHDRINPLMEMIWTALLTFDANLERSANEDINTLDSLAQQQGITIWGIATVCLIFIVLGYFSFDRAVLKPMLKLANVFLQEARKGGMAALPEPKSRETRDLIQAFTEMRDQIHSRQEALEHQAQHDALTGLANRNLLYQQLSQAIGKNRRHTDDVSLIMLDLDRFKEANDALGHHMGDLLLIEVGKRLRDEFRENDVVARLGGDEFAVLLYGADETQAKNVCMKILKSFEQPFDIQGQQLFVGASLGIAVHPQHGNDAETMIKRADIAMYVAKRNRLGFAFYEATTDNYDTRYLSLAHDLRCAINEGTLDIVYQLKYDIALNQPVGVEALLRWEHPQHGSVSPVNIIPLAEQLGIINRLTSWVMEQAIQQCSRWRKQDIFISVAINLSVYDLLTIELVEQISRLLEKYEVPATYVVIEVTENAMLIDPNNAIGILQKLDDMGLRIAIDDFGAGFSSLGYLKKLPVDELKIDKSFVLDMIENENDAVIVRSTIDLAHNLGLRVVAEGVESEEIYDLLRILRCDTAQGYFLAKPVNAGEITRIIEAQHKAARPYKLG
ncbi:MAG: EAL domain-containing protein [Gammaproteobacteria bacterium]|nr:EAL domain-containing protein [Gammaproteobacteria bacterium]